MVGEPNGFLHTVGSVSWGLLITVFSLGHLGFLIVLPASANPDGGGGRFAHVSHFSNTVQRCHAIYCREIVRATAGDPACEQGENMGGFDRWPCNHVDTIGFTGSLVHSIESLGRFFCGTANWLNGFFWRCDYFRP